MSASGHRCLRPLAMLLLPALVAFGPATAPASANEPGEVTIYRCTGSDGRVSLGNTPCADGQQEQQRVMQRPQDPPAGTVAAAPSPAPAAAPPARNVRVVSVRPPQPMYACTTPDGERYLSNEDRATPRWVPLWVAGRAAATARGPHAPEPGAGRPPHPGAAVAATGTWVHDACERLAQEEACQHLSDRRYEILRTYHAAAPGEQRQALDAEQAALDQRLASDCGS